MQKLLLALVIGICCWVSRSSAAPPTNDNFASAAPLTGANGSIHGTLREATAEPDEPTPSVWYKFTPTVDGVAIFTTVRSLATIGASGALLQIFTGADFASRHAATGLATRHSIYVHAGVEYRIGVDDPTRGDGSVTDFELTYTSGATMIRAVPVMAQVEEHVGTLRIYVQRSGNLRGISSVRYETIIGDASAEADFVSASGVLNFAANEKRKPIDLAIKPDQLSEENEQFWVVLSQPVGAFLGNDATTITILDDGDDPANDDFSAAVDIGSTSGIISGTTVGADTQVGEYGGLASVWYKWEATDTSVVQFRIEAGQPELDIFEGVSLGQLRPVTRQSYDSDTGTNRRVANMTAGATYYIRADGRGTPEPFTFSWQSYGSEIRTSSNFLQGVQGETVSVHLSRTGDLAQTVAITAQTLDDSAREGTDYTLPTHSFTFGAGVDALEIPFTLLNTGSSNQKEAFITFNITGGSATFDGENSLYLYIRPPDSNPNPPPANDDFAEAIAVTSGDYVSDSARNSTREAGEPAHTGTGFGTVWYKWTPASSGWATVTTYGGYLALYTGFSLTSLSPLSTINADYGSASFAASSGTTYYLAFESERYVDFLITSIRSVFEFNDSALFTKENAGTFSFGVRRQGDLSTAASVRVSSGGGPAVEGIDFTIVSSQLDFAANQAVATAQITLADDLMAQGVRQCTLLLKPISVSDAVSSEAQLQIADDDDDPANNDFAAAIQLNGSSGTAHGTLEGADREAGEPQLGWNASIWYRWTAPADGVVTFESVRATVLAAYTGNSLVNLNLLDSADSNDPQVRFNAVKNAVYYIAVAGFDSNDSLDSNDGYDSNDPAFSFGATMFRYSLGGAGSGPRIRVEQTGGATTTDGGQVDFGERLAETSATREFTITNTGIATLSLATLRRDGAHGADFAFSQPGSQTLAPGASTTFTITFTPSGLGRRSAAFHLPNNGGDDATFDLIATGTGLPILPAVTTTQVSELGVASATLHGTVNAQGRARSISFEYGTTTSYGLTASATPGTLSDSVSTAVSANVTGLLPHTIYHYRVRAAGDLGSASGLDKTFVTGNTVPAAFDDTLVVVPPGGPLNVLANDFDADGDSLVIRAKTAVTPPNAGSISLVGGQLIFSASAGFASGAVSSASFSYTIEDAAGDTATASVVVTAGTATIDPTTAEVAAAGGGYPISVTSPGGFSVSEPLPWVTVTPTGAPGSASVQVTVKPNASKSARSGTIRIGDKTHAITQKGIEARPSIGPLGASRYEAIVGGNFSLLIPTLNGPAIYTAANLPPGLSLSNVTGTITGRPTSARSYHVTVRARNAEGPADEALEFDIDVVPLAGGVVGTFHGLIERNLALNNNLASRVQITTRASGAYSCRVITGASDVPPFKGQLDASPADPARAVLSHIIPGTDQLLELVLDGPTSTLSGTLTDGISSAGVNAWRDAWDDLGSNAAALAGYYSYYLDQPAADVALPRGFGHGSVTVVQRTGKLKLAGKLADGSNISGSSFVGPGGQVLVYVPLYANRGTFAGTLTIARGSTPPLNNTITGTPTWLKPVSPATARDTVYRAGFGPAAVTAAGSLYEPPENGLRVLGLPAVQNNAQCSFTLGGLDTEAKEFGVPVTIRNPRPNGLTNSAFVPLNANNVTIPSLDAATGTFAGSFTLPGANARLNRIGLFSGQIVTTGAETKGYGFFLLPTAPSDGASVATSPKLSGAVTLDAAP